MVAASGMGSRGALPRLIEIGGVPTFSYLAVQYREEFTPLNEPRVTQIAHVAAGLVSGNNREFIISFTVQFAFPWPMPHSPRTV